jgi:hypothetical protein
LGAENRILKRTVFAHLKFLKITSKADAEGSAPGFEAPTLFRLVNSREEPDTCGGLQRNLSWP